MPGHAYTPEEIALVSAHPHLTSTQLAPMMPGRQPKGIAELRKRMGWAYQRPLKIRIRKKKPDWHDADNDIIRANGQLYSHQIKPLLSIDRSLAAIVKQRMKLGVPGPKTPNNTDKWMAAEKAILAANPKATADDLMPLLPGRKRRAIVEQRRKGQFKRPPALHKHTWTAEEKAILVANPDRFSTQFGDLLPNRSSQAIRNQRIAGGYPHITKPPGCLPKAPEAPKPPKVIKVKAPKVPKPAKPPKPVVVKPVAPPKLRVVTPPPAPKPIVIPAGQFQCAGFERVGPDAYRRCRNPVSWKGRPCPVCILRGRRSA